MDKKEPICRMGYDDIPNKKMKGEEILCLMWEITHAQCTLCIMRGGWDSCWFSKGYDVKERELKAKSDPK